MEAGSVVGIIGKNGAGKTTLLEVLLGFAPASTGTSQLFGHDSFTLPAAIKGRIGFVPQEDELVQLITGRQQLALNAALQGHWNHALIERLQQAWEVPMDQTIQSLSGGERQKLSILSALGHEPELLVLDEPVASLDPISRRRFLQETDRHHRRPQPHGAVLLAHHLGPGAHRRPDLDPAHGVIAWAGPLDALKESVVRLSVTARKPLPATLPPTPCHLAAGRSRNVRASWSAIGTSRNGPAARGARCRYRGRVPGPRGHLR